MMTNIHAFRFRKFGGPEVLTWEEVALAAPGEGQVTVQHNAVGLNFIDVYHRIGLYPATFPSGLGYEAAGHVTALGAGVTDFQLGDRVAYATGPLGAYGQALNVPVDRLVPVPDGIDDRQAAAMMLQGLTAQYLLRETYRVQSGDAILVHAAAGGVGLILCQWAKHLGASVIGTVGSEQKADLAAAHGCEYPILYKTENFVDRVREITGGGGVAVVYDSVGADTFMDSLDCLRRRGLMVSFGNSSGPPPALEVGSLASKGSLYVTRPSLFHYTATKEALLSGAQALFDVVQSGAVKIEINQTYPLRDAPQAHADLQARKTTGSTVFIV